MSETTYRVLGLVEVVHRGRVLPIRAPRQCAVLACLLLEANRVVSVERLASQLWGDDPPARARNTVQSLVLRLRQALPTESSHPLVTRPPGYAIQVDPRDLDLAVFEALSAQGRRQLSQGDAPAAAATLRSALALWQGDPLAGAAGRRLQEVEAVHLVEMRLRVLEDRIAADLALGRDGELIGELRRAIADCPLRERLYAMLMIALYREGRQAEAFDAFHFLRRRLVDELAVEPTDLVRDLYGRMLDHVPTADLISAGSARVCLTGP